VTWNPLKEESAVAAPLFRSLLGAAFEELDPCLRAVHGGESRVLRGIATVERGTTLAAAVLCALASLPRNMQSAAIEVRIEVSEQGERWTRRFGRGRAMRSTLRRGGNLLVEQLGPAQLEFILGVRETALEWTLARITLAGIPLPVEWFHVTARAGVQSGRYHFLIDSAARGIGRIVRYEGELDADA
jgi:hypothetical protein